ncbi:DUF4397 domain-containing protein [Mucilaginibacter sp. L196]|uniref:DUF4397 domain-containing protein n=1 Tax=Mucilaginibacter sp. L196 TaxID=1641870 RepID=UPI00131C86B1|nr:DUF4397 domain-containing protein [Mucilaginibacter sp. L196]
MNLNFTKIKGVHQLGTVPLLTGIACLLAVSISSCTKSDNSSNTNVPYGVLSVVAASPDAPAADFYINSSIVNGAALTYGNYIPYFKSTTGVTKAGFFDTGSLTTIAIDTINIKVNQVYTLFFANLVAKHDFLLTTDTLVAPANGNASIRLANMSPNAPNVDLVIGGKVIVSNKSYKQVSSFITIPVSGNDTLKIVQTGTSNLLGVVNAVTVQSEGVYTIWLYGFANGTNGQGLNANLMQNALF